MRVFRVVDISSIDLVKVGTFFITTLFLKGKCLGKVFRALWECTFPPHTSAFPSLAPSVMSSSCQRAK